MESLYFTDAWEQRKLSDVATIKKGNQLGKTKQKNIGPFYVLNGGIEPSGYTDRFNREADVISISEGGNSCGYVNYNAKRFWSGGHCYTLHNVKVDDKFLYQNLKKEQDNIMALRVGSGLPNIQKTSLSNFLVSITSEREENSVGNLLSNLDTLITLHQRK